MQSDREQEHIQSLRWVGGGGVLRLTTDDLWKNQSGEMSVIVDRKGRSRRSKCGLSCILNKKILLAPLTPTAFYLYVIGAARRFRMPTSQPQP